MSADNPLVPQEQKVGSVHHFVVMTKWRMGMKGKSCAKCGFKEAAHIKHDLQWDMDDYPCSEFTPQVEDKIQH